MIATGGKVDPIDNSSKMVKVIKSSLNVNNEEAAEMENIFKSIGIDEIDSIEADEVLDEYEGVGSKGYRVKANFSQNNNIILYVSSDNKIICIRWADKDFYRDGKILLNFNDYLFDSSDKVLEEVLYSIAYSVFANYDVSMVMFEVNDQHVDEISRDQL